MTAGEAAAVAPGQPASVVFEALGGIPVAGVVHSVGRISDPNSGTYPVEIWLAGDVAAQLREGMVGAVQLASQGAVVPGPAVPRSALFRQAGRMHVFVVAAERAKLVPVTMGRGDATHVMINAGLQVGDQVVVDGQFALRDGAAVQTN